MRRIRLFHAGNLNVNETVHLNIETSRHLIQVLRKKVGDPCWIFNGDGDEYEGTITAIEKKIAVIAIANRYKPHVESPIKIHLGQAISRGERMDYAIQKAVELGVCEITPLFTEFCQVKLSDERFEKKVAHWQAVATSAAEQSGRCIVPMIHAPILFREWIKQVCELKFICCPRQSESMSLKDMTSVNQVMLCIGSEGGFSDVEVAAALQQQFMILSLGPRVLRTETATVTALSVIQYQMGDL